MRRPAQVQAATGLPVAINIYGRDANGARLCRPLLHGRRPGRLAARRRQVRAAVSDLGGQHLDRTDGGARAGAGAGEILRHRLRRRRASIAAAAACARGCASCTTTACRRWRRSIRKASASPCRDCIGGLPGGGVRGVVLDPDGNVVHDCGTGELVTLTRTDRIVEVQLGGRRRLRRSARAAGRAGGAGRGGGHRVAGSRGDATMGCRSLPDKAAE